MALLHYTIFNLGLLRPKVATLENYTMAPHNKGRPLSSLTREWQVRPSSVTCLLSDPAVPSPVRGTYLFLFVPTEIGVILTVINFASVHRPGGLEWICPILRDSHPASGLPLISIRYSPAYAQRN